MAGERQIFQEKALARLRRPARSGQLLSITSTSGWVVLAAVMITIFSVALWSVFGIMADKVSGYGILVNGMGATNITPLAGGRILSMEVAEGDYVTKGQRVATLEQTQMEQQLYLEAMQAKNADSQADMRTRTAQLASTRELLHESSEVLSPYDGIVTSQRHRVGDIVATGVPLYDLCVDGGENELMAVLYVPALMGDKVRPGTVVQVSPGAVDASLYGALVGRVTRVSEFPVSSDRIVYWTGNEELASWIVKQAGGAVMEVQVALIRDDTTSSGYLWTTLAGPEDTVVIKQGMTCTATAIVNREAPLVKAFNKLGQWLRSD